MRPGQPPRLIYQPADPGANGRRLVSAFQVGQFLVHTFYDVTEDRWAFEQWHRGALQQEQTSGSDAASIEAVFLRGARAHLDHRRMNDRRAINADYLDGPVPSLRTFDPRRRPGRRDLFGQHRDD